MSPFQTVRRCESSWCPPSPREESPLLRMMDLAVETGIPDLATNVDHYLYGHPKAGNAE